MFPIPPAIINTSAVSGMAYIGSYTYATFAAAPLEVNDLVIYFQNYPGSEPTGGSGNKWTTVVIASLPTVDTFLATKLIQVGDIGVAPTNPAPSLETDARFIVYRGPLSINFKTYGLGLTQSFTKSSNFTGMLLTAFQRTAVTYTPQTPTTWQQRRQQNTTDASQTQSKLALYDRIEPANSAYTSGSAITGTSTSTTGAAQTVIIYEFLTP